jgi:hypothetical protein
MWGDVEFNASLSNEFSDVINDDFLIVDGLDDFSGFPDIDAASMFNESKLDFSSSNIDDEEDNTEDSGEDRQAEDIIKREEADIKKVRYDRSRSPSPKRRRSIAPMDISPVPVKSMSPVAQESLLDLQEQYKRAVEQLAVSMRRSEMTRSEIISFRKEQETRTQLQEAQSRTFNSADGFLTGSQVTLTTGLAQSRQMLKNYMSLSAPL